MVENRRRVAKQTNTSRTVFVLNLSATIPHSGTQNMVASDLIVLIPPTEEFDRPTFLIQRMTYG